MRHALLLAWLLWQNSSEEGQRALEKRDYPAAVAAYRRAVAASPQDLDAQFQLALALSLQGNDREAIDAYRRVLQIKPDVTEAQLNLGILLLRQQQAAEALPLLRGVAEKKPKDYLPLYTLGQAQLATGAVSEAATTLRRALAAEPNAADAHLALGKALAAQGQWQEALAEHRTAAERDAALRPALLDLAQQAEQANQKELAATLYGEFPDNAAARERLRGLQPPRGNSVSELEADVRESPTLENRRALATAYLEAKQPDKAVEQLRAALSLAPADATLPLNIGRILRDQRRFAEAAQQFLAAVQRQPDLAAGWNELAGVLVLLEQYPQAIAALDRSKALGGEVYGHHYLRAIVLDRLKQYKPALDSYREFLRLSEGRRPDEEFKSRQRIKVIEKELARR